MNNISQKCDYLEQREIDTDLDFDSTCVELQDHLAECAECKAQYEQIEALKEGISSLSETVPPLPKFDSDKFRATVKSKSSRTKTRTRSLRPISSRRRQVRRFSPLPWIVGAAASVALAWGLAITFGNNNFVPLTAKLTAVTGKVEIKRNGKTVTASNGIALAHGDIIHSADQSLAHIKLRDGSVIELAPQSTFSVDLQNEENRGNVVAGRIFVTAAKQKTGRKFTLNGQGNNKISVLGTTFEVAVADDKTELLVEEGRVRFGRAEKNVEVVGGFQSSVSNGYKPSAPKKLQISKLAAWRIPAAKIRSRQALENGDIQLAANREIWLRADRTNIADNGYSVQSWGNKSHTFIQSDKDKRPSNADGNLYFDGKNDYLEIKSIKENHPLALGETEFTIAAWFKQSSGGTIWQRIIDKSTEQSGANGYALALKPDKKEVWLMVGGNHFVSSSNCYQKDTWTHVAVVVTNTKNAIYINGKKDFDASFAKDKHRLAPAVPGSLRIGAWCSSLDRRFKGNMDDIVVFTRALSDKEIRWLAGQ